ncbi:hypothetical protein LINGRAHAP2_LOCUS19453 [Linum grandiflorum]
MSATNTSKLTLKLLVDKKKNRVLFAEAGKDFVDFLFSIPSLPLATVSTLLSKTRMVGCLGNLYHSIQLLSDTFIQPGRNKSAVLNPKATFHFGGESHTLAGSSSSSSDSNTSRKFYTCANDYYNCSHGYMADNTRTICPGCRCTMDKEITLVAAAPTVSNSGELGFVKGVVSYMVMDNLEVKPMSTISFSSIALLNEFNIQQVGDLVEKVVELGMDKREEEPPFFNSDHKMATNTKVTLKLLVDKVNNRVLFAEAGKEFVDFLFSIFSLPLGTVITLLSKTQMTGSLGNLYRSIEELSDNFIESTKSKETALKPKFQSRTTGNSNLLMLTGSEKKKETSAAPKKYYVCSNYNSYSYHRGDVVTDDPQTVCPSCNYRMSLEVRFIGKAPAAKDKNQDNGFVKDVINYMVMDNLEVKPLSMISSITMLSKFNIQQVGSLEEKVVELGMDEVLNLLKASLECKTVLTRVFLGA